MKGGFNHLKHRFVFRVWFAMQNPGHRFVFHVGFAVPILKRMICAPSCVSGVANKCNPRQSIYTYSELGLRGVFYLRAHIRAYGEP